MMPNDNTEVVRQHQIVLQERQQCFSLFKKVKVTILEFSQEIAKEL